MSVSRKVFVASDHAGFEMKSVLMKRLPAASLTWPSACEFIDLGPANGEHRVDYPDYARLLCESMIRENLLDVPSGILICGSGQGMAIAANRYKEIRAALCFSEDFAVLAREHNDANVLCLAGRFTAPDLAVAICGKFFSTAFLGGRHQARVQKLANLC
jgi:ribose 5-phosphate isomerase B